MEIQIDKEFQDLIPPLSSDEYAQLEQNCIKDGIRDALVVWKRPEGGDVLIDGHNRYRIAEENNLEFRTEERAFPDRDSVTVWILKNQLGRRNLSNYDRSVLVLKLKPLLQAEAKKRQGNRTDLTNIPQKSAESGDELAQIAGVSHDTIHKVETIERYGSPEEENIAELIDRIREEERREEAEA